MNTPFDKMFDFNHDGKLDCFERAARDGLLMKIDNDLRNNDKLVAAGIKPDEFACLSDDEKRAELRKAKLDPDEFGL